jgi:hypothetical protein
MSTHQRRTLSVSVVKHPGARVPAALNQDVMSNTDNIVLDHIVELFLPTQCGVCREPLPEDIRDAFFKDMEGRFSDAFGGFSLTRIQGGWKMPDGTLAVEPVDVLCAMTAKQGLEQHGEDVRLWAVEVADRLSQDRVALRFDKRMAFFPRSNPKAPCAHKTSGKVPATAAAMQAAVKSAAPPRDIDRLYAIQSILSRFGSLSDVRALFCGTLGYTYADSQLPAAKWPDALRQVLRGQPQTIADTNGFRIVYLCLAADRLLRGPERAVINRILRDDPAFHGLFVVSDGAQKQWRLVNARQEAKDSTRFLLRRLSVGAGSGVRTATERLSLIDLENRPNLTAPALQELHDQAFDVESVTRQFFLEIANWYFWALRHARFPEHAPKEADGLDHISVIRLITRLIFCWFVKEKGLIPDDLFNQRKLENTLAGFAPDKASNKDSVFYRAILQNLFFATLNTEMDKRGWVKDEQHFMAHSLYRHRDCFQKPNDALGLFKSIPFLNGGLFECLDKDLGEGSRPRYIRIDGFSRREDSQPTVPDFLFFGPEREVNLSKDYGDDRYERVPVRGLIHTLRRYNFTIEENTPLDQDVALDPELSGKVFENLLAAYNPETGATARKQTGSFYTPREIVDYMVDEALIAYLKTKLEAAVPAAKDVEARLRHLFAYNDEPHRFSPAEVDILIAAIDNLKALDPAVGSGAFPMGILHRLVFILGKLDPRNEKWKERQIQRVRDAMTTAERIEDATIRESSLRELEQQIANIKEAFEHNELDYGRKLYLIENCIYGVDIQTIAVQIAKMRFFISLIVDQRIDDTKPNRGVRPLPNLETKFVAANTLIGVNRPGQQMLRNREIEAKEAELRRVRERHFMARTLASKAKCRERDAKLRAEIASLLQGNRLPDEVHRHFQNLADKLSGAFDAAEKDVSRPTEATGALTPILAAAGQELLDIQGSPGVPPLAAARIEELRQLLTRPCSGLKQAPLKATGLMVLLNDLRASSRSICSDLLSGQGLSAGTARELASWDPYNQNATAAFFDPEWMFGACGGFEITIGNPPYVRADEQSDWNRRQREQILASGSYETLWEKWDLFVPFIERAYKLLKPGGVTTLIVSDAFCHSKYAQKPQNWFLQHARILRLDFCSDLQIFDAAVHNLIYVFQRADDVHNVPERRVHRKEFGNVTVLPSDEQSKLTYRAFFPEQSAHYSFTAHVIPIGQICYVSFGCRPNSDEKIAKGLFVAADLVSERKDRLHPKPYIEAKDIGRWTYQRYRWLEWGTDRSPELLTRPTFEELYEVPEKIVAADVSGAENRAAYDVGQVFHSHTLISFVPWNSLRGVRNNSLKKAARYQGERPPRPDLPKREELEATSRRFAVKYLLGVMNSTVARDLLRAHRRSNIHLYPDDWKKLPIPDLPPERQKGIVALVDELLAAKRANPSADTTALECEIDRQVYALYGLTPEEIKIVEGAAQ